MSRTDAHRPMEVWIADEPSKRVERHNHINHPCDLPDPTDNEAAGYRRDGCYWDLNWYEVRLCSCDMCSGAYGRKRGRRRSRSLERRLAIAYIRGEETRRIEALEGALHESDATWAW